MTDILIPTMRKPTELDAMLTELRGTVPGDWRVIASCEPVSASRNRNLCLGQAASDLLIMIDDDISGFYRGWAQQLLRPLKVDPHVCMVSARLMTTDGLPGPTCSMCYEMDRPTIEVKPTDHCVLPSAAIAFRNLGLRFDEKFKGSGWEDNDFCFQYLRRNPWFKFIQSNECKLIHANEQKRQSEYWTHNEEYFEWKWGSRHHASLAAQ